MGLIFLSLSLLLAVYMIHAGVSPAVRGVLFVPFFAAAFGAYQGLFRTCTHAAKMGVRLTDQGDEPMASPDDLKRSRRDSRKVLIGSIATALVATLVVAAIP